MSGFGCAPRLSPCTLLPSARLWVLVPPCPARGGAARGSPRGGNAGLLQEQLGRQLRAAAVSSCPARGRQSTLSPRAVWGLRAPHPGAWGRGRARGAARGRSGAAGGAEGAQSRLCPVTPVLSLLTRRHRSRAGVWGCSWGPLCSLAANGTRDPATRKCTGGEDRVYPAPARPGDLMGKRSRVPLHVCRQQTRRPQCGATQGCVWGSCSSGPGAPGGSWWVTSLCLLQVSLPVGSCKAISLCALRWGGSWCHPSPPGKCSRMEGLILAFGITASPAAQQCPLG